MILKDGRSFPVSSIESEDDSGYVVNMNPNKRPIYKELITLKYQDIMYSIYEAGRMLHYDMQGLPFKNERVIVSKSRESNPIGFLFIPSFAAGIWQFMEMKKSIDARDKFRKGSSFYRAFNDEANKQRIFSAAGFIGSIIFAVQGKGTENYSIRRTDETLLGLQFREFGLAATLNW